MLSAALSAVMVDHSLNSDDNVEYLFSQQTLLGDRYITVIPLKK
jgi:hypothetical protein